MRMIRSDQWDAAAVVARMASSTLRPLPPADGVLSLIGDSTVKDKRGRHHPLGHMTRHSAHDPYTFGVEMVLLIASGGRFRGPVALAPIDPTIQGHQNILLRQMRKACVDPAWGRQVIVSGDAGGAANATLRLHTQQKYAYGFAVPRTRKFTNGTHLRDLVQHLPKRCSYRRARHTPDGRRRDSWGFLRRATRPPLGAVRLVLSKNGVTMGRRACRSS
jgi:hypothetical protein